jgi:hypothetical protein
MSAKRREQHPAKHEKTAGSESDMQARDCHQVRSARRGILIPVVASNLLPGADRDGQQDGSGPVIGQHA